MPFELHSLSYKCQIYDLKPWALTMNFLFQLNVIVQRIYYFCWTHDTIIFEIYLFCFEAGRIVSFCYFSYYLILLLNVIRKTCAYSAWRGDIKELVSRGNCLTSCCLAELTFRVLRELLFFVVWLAVLLRIEKVPSSDLGLISS